MRAADRRTRKSLVRGRRHGPTSTTPVIVRPSPARPALREITNNEHHRPAGNINFKQKVAIQQDKLPALFQIKCHGNNATKRAPNVSLPVSQLKPPQGSVDCDFPSPPAAVLPTLLASKDRKLVPLPVQFENGTNLDLVSMEMTACTALNQQEKNGGFHTVKGDDIGEICLSKDSFDPPCCSTPIQTPIQATSFKQLKGVGVANCDKISRLICDSQKEDGINSENCDQATMLSACDDSSTKVLHSDMKPVKKRRKRQEKCLGNDGLVRNAKPNKSKSNNKVCSITQSLQKWTKLKNKSLPQQDQAKKKMELPNYATERLTDKRHRISLTRTESLQYVSSEVPLCPLVELWDDVTVPQELCMVDSTGDSAINLDQLLSL